MSIQSEEASSGLAPVPQPWNEVWIKALTRPSVATYQDFVSRPEVSSRRAYIWVFLASVVASGLTLLGILLFGSLAALGAEEALDLAGGFLIVILGFVCLAPLGGLFAILGLAIIAGISQAIARALGGSGTYSELSYSFGAYLAPLGIVSSVLSLIPFINLLTIPLGIYGLFLNILAVKSVHRFGWGRALASSFVIIFALILIVVAVGAIVILALLGPAIGNVFSNIIQDIGTPIP